MVSKTSPIIFFLVFFVFSCQAQMDKYSYRRTLTGNPGFWNSVILPDDVFGKISNDFSDIRVYGINGKKDTIEAPYLLRVKEEKNTGHDVALNIINKSHDGNRHYITFEIPEGETVNQIRLQFNNRNFDWKTVLEGSTDQAKWFTILDDYRILSIKNDHTDFQFTE